MTKKLLAARIGAGSITVALCAALPGCNLALAPTNPGCVGHPSSRGQSLVVCEPDASGGDQAGDETGGDGPTGWTGDGPTDTRTDQGGDAP